MQIAIGAIAFILSFFVGAYSDSVTEKVEQVLGAPSPQLTYNATLLPLSTNLYDLGTTTKRWRDLYVQQICLSGDCRTSWPSSGGGGSGNLATSSTETQFRVPFWDSTSATPALLNGGDSTFTFSPNADRLTLSYATTTGISSGYASSTLLIGGLLTVNTSITMGGDTLTDFVGGGLSVSSGALTVNDVTAAMLNAEDFGSFTCNGTTCTVDNNAIALTTQTSGNYVESITGTANQITVANGSGAEDLDATLSIPIDFRVSSTTISGNLLTSNATTSSLGVQNLTASNCDVKSTTSGSLFCGTDATSAGAADPFTFETHFGVLNAATSSVVWAKLGLNASSTSHFTNIEAINGTTTNATSTNVNISGTLDVDGITSALGLFGSSGILGEFAGASCTNQFPQSASAAGAWTCDSVVLTTDVSGILPYANGGTGTTTAPVGQVLYGGATAYQSVATSSLSCTGNILCTATTVLGAASSISFTGDLPFANLTQGAANTVLANTTGATGDFAALATTSLFAATNGQVLGRVGGLWVGVATTTAGTGITYTGSAFNLNLGNANTWTALQQFSNASSTLFSCYGPCYFGATATSSFSTTGILDLVDAAAPTFSNAGQIAWDNTSFNLLAATSSNNTPIVLGGATTTLYSFVVASTSPDFASGGIIPLPSHFLAQVATAVICKVDGGTSQQIFLSDGTNDTNTLTCTTTETQFALTTNNTWTAYERTDLEFVTKSGSPDYITIRVVGYRQAN